MRRIFSVLLAVAILLSTTALPAVAASDDSGDMVTDIGASHGLDTADAISEYNEEEVVDTDLSRVDMTVTLAESKDDIGMADQLTPSNIRNDFIRLNYREDADRTVRILIPSEYWTPYLREDVESVTGEHTAEFKPVRGGDYLSVIVKFDGETDAVFPVQWDSSLSYKAVERTDERLNKSLGFKIRGDNTGWAYVDGRELTSGPGYEMENSSGEVTVQYDATADTPDELWVNAPEGEPMRGDIYYYSRSENSTKYIVSKSDDPPDVRYKTDPTFSDKIRGDINDLREAPSRFIEAVRGD